MLLYQIGIRLYSIAIRIASLFSPKAKTWINGRRNQQVFTPQDPNRQRIWMHVASVGEFEQGLPLIQQIKNRKPQVHFIVTFFSPSGYEQVNDPIIDEKYYLPIDTSQNAKRFITDIDPHLAIFVKYDFWYHTLRVLQERHIPTIFISSLFRPSQWFFKWPFGKMKAQLMRVNQIFVQDQNSYDLLDSQGFSNMRLSGDTRIDRARQLPNEDLDLSIIEDHFDLPFDVICGSVWPADLKILVPALKNSSVRAVIAPHQMDEAMIRDFEAMFPNETVRYTQLENQNNKGAFRFLILDTYGMLSRIYRIGKMAYIGGGFGPGIHNTLEPAAFGLPIVFGPNYDKFVEANYLVEQDIATTVTDQGQLVEAIKKGLDKNYRQTTSDKLELFFQEHQGSAEEVVQYLVDMKILM